MEFRHARLPEVLSCAGALCTRRSDYLRSWKQNKIVVAGKIPFCYNTCQSQEGARENLPQSCTLSPSNGAWDEHHSAFYEENCRKHLRMKAFKKSRCQALTEPRKIKKKQRCSEHLARFKNRSNRNILFADEKLSSLQFNRSLMNRTTGSTTGSKYILIRMWPSVAVLTLLQLCSSPG